jgi:quercetin dioxygenase-like cupin family protein
MDIGPRTPIAKGPSDWFTGDVWTDPVAPGHGDSFPSIGCVDFTSAARTAWYSHSIGQTLYVTKGEGRVPSRGEPVVTICSGDVVTRQAASEKVLILNSEVSAPGRVRRRGDPTDPRWRT